MRQMTAITPSTIMMIAGVGALQPAAVGGGVGDVRRRAGDHHDRPRRDRRHLPHRHRRLLHDAPPGAAAAAGEGAGLLSAAAATTKLKTTTGALCAKPRTRTPPHIHHLPSNRTRA